MTNALKAVLVVLSIIVADFHFVVKWHDKFTRSKTLVRFETGAEYGDAGKLAREAN